MTRNTSIGFAGSEMGVPMSACSIGPLTPLESCGEAFQQVGVMIWYLASDGPPVGDGLAVEMLTQ